jgi:hypothetical protein
MAESIQAIGGHRDQPIPPGQNESKPVLSVFICGFDPSQSFTYRI